MQAAYVLGFAYPLASLREAFHDRDLTRTPRALSYINLINSSLWSAYYINLVNSSLWSAYRLRLPTGGQSAFPTCWASSSPRAGDARSAGRAA